MAPMEINWTIVSTIVQAKRSMKPILFNNIEFKEIMQQVKELVRDSENYPDEQARERTAELLKYFDLLHREPLARMVETIERSYPDLMDILKQDYTINTLLELYDFDKINKADE